MSIKVLKQKDLHVHQEYDSIQRVAQWRGVTWNMGHVHQSGSGTVCPNNRIQDTRYSILYYLTNEKCQSVYAVTPGIFLTLAGTVGIK